jgi:hypothetical protein
MSQVIFNDAVKCYDYIDYENVWTLDGGEQRASHPDNPGRFNSKERAPGTHLTGDWVGLRVGVNVGENSKISPPTRN